MSDADHDRPVGYGRPPTASRFRPGQSGNPAGRPKRRPCLQSVLLAELAKPAHAGSQPTSTKLDEFAKALVESAIAGNARAAALLVGVLLRFEQSEQEETQVQTSDDREILEAYLRNRRGPIAGESETNRSVSENNEQQR